MGLSEHQLFCTCRKWGKRSPKQISRIRGQRELWPSSETKLREASTLKHKNGCSMCLSRWGSSQPYKNRMFEKVLEISKREADSKNPLLKNKSWFSSDLWGPMFKEAKTSQLKTIMQRARWTRSSADSSPQLNPVTQTYSGQGEKGY